MTAQVAARPSNGMKITLVGGAQDPLVNRQPIQSLAPKKQKAHSSLRYEYPSSPRATCSNSSKELEESYYVPNDYYLYELEYDFDMFKKN
jgi:hypothetical protein